MHRHYSSIVQTHRETTLADVHGKSDTYVDLNKRKAKRSDDGLHKCSDDYYKNYDYDDVPVRDDSSSDNFKCRGSDTVDSETNAASALDLDVLENKIYGDLSQELRTDSSCVASLESNIKLFRTTVEEIFDTFRHAMTDFELYKRRFDEILSKNKEQSIAEMEDFIKDMFQHIASSESALSQYMSKSTQQSSEVESNVAVGGSTGSGRSDAPKATIEAYRNDNYKTDSCTGDDNCADRSRTGAFCINFLNRNRCVQIKLNNRDMLSEINIREKEREVVEAASAENVRRLNAKKLEVDSIRLRDEQQAVEKDIPVKISNPKKNIHLDEDFTNGDADRVDSTRSFFYRICNYLCRKLRKTA